MRTLDLKVLRDPDERQMMRKSVALIHVLEKASGRVPTEAFLTGMIMDYLHMEVREGNITIPDGEDLPLFIHEIVAIVKEAVK